MLISLFVIATIVCVCFRYVLSYFYDITALRFLSRFTIISPGLSEVVTLFNCILACMYVCVCLCDIISFLAHQIRVFDILSWDRNS